MILINLFDFSVFQDRYADSKRSDELFLVAFQCPQLLLKNVHEFMSVIKVLLSGDVELYPGPPTTRNNSQTQPAGLEELPGNDDSEPVMPCLGFLKNALRKMKKANSAYLNSIQCLSITLEKINEKVTSMSECLVCVEIMVESLESLRNDVALEKNQKCNKRKRSQINPARAILRAEHAGITFF